jgi:dienelactone hydrolase
MMLLLGGCGAPVPVLKPDEAQVKQFAGRGYQSDEHYGVSTSFVNWELNGPDDTCEFALTLPARSGKLPVVLYLPGLGENRAAGESWRTAWASTGYAVISIQPLTQDSNAWRSPKALAGDFAGLARDRYAGKAMAARVAALQQCLSEVRRRQNSGEAPFDRLDLSKVAVAGYDLGAYTAMVLAGEPVRQAQVPALPIDVAAVIALSPYADFSGLPLSERYQQIRPPVLSITSPADTDPLNLVSSPSLRKAPYEYMPAGDKYLLSLGQVSHRVLSGEVSEPSAAAEQAERSAKSAGMGNGSAGRSGRGGRSKGAAGMAGEGVMPVRPDGQPANSQLLLTQQAQAVAAVQSVSSAFLDAVFRQDGIAREWLTQDAKRWLRGVGELQRK